MTKEQVNEQRMKAVEGVVNKAIDDYLRETGRALNRVADTFCLRLDELLVSWRAWKTNGFEFEQTQSRAMMSSSDDDKARTVDILSTDFAELANLRNQLNESAA